MPSLLCEEGASPLDLGLKLLKLEEGLDDLVLRLFIVRLQRTVPRTGTEATTMVSMMSTSVQYIKVETLSSGNHSAFQK